MHNRRVRWSRSVVTWIAAGATTITAVVIGIATADAADGTGQSWSWRYDSGTELSYVGTFPGVHLDGGATDANGVRQVRGTLHDTAVDGQCAALNFHNEDGDSDVRFEVRACDGEGPATFDVPGITGQLEFFMGLGNRSNVGLNRFFAEYIPESAHDPGLRVAGTGASFRYVGPDEAQFSMARTGVTLSGTVRPEQGLARRIDATVRLTGNGDCANSVGAAAYVVAGGSVEPVHFGFDCTGGGGTVSGGGLVGYIDFRGCYDHAIDEGHCLESAVPLVQ